MKMKPIKTEDDYEIALEKAYNLIQMDLKPDSAESDELEIISVLIEDYEKKHYVIEAPDPIEAIKFRMEQMNMTRKDLEEILGYKSRVSEIFSKKRKLTLDMIRKLNEKLNIPVSVLIKSY
jgi:HTH-type transcriptional regulator/antitoxin HigA